MTPILPVDLPEDASPLTDKSEITSQSVYVYDLMHLNGKSVHVVLSNGDTLTGMINFRGKMFTVGTDDYEYRIADVVHFREV